MTRAAVSRRHFLQLAGAGMLALTGTALTGCGNSTSGEVSDKGSKLAAIKSRGHLNAGVKKDVPGYGYYDTAKGRFEGMEVDLCYQIAAAVLAQLNATTIPVNVTHFNGNPTQGSGQPNDPVRPA